MSADNFHLIRRAGDRFVVTMEFAADREGTGAVASALAGPAPVDDRSAVWFDSLDDARDYCDDDWTEYGIVEDVDGDASDDTLVARLVAVARVLEERCPMSGPCFEASQVTLQFGETVVSVTGPDAWAVGEWLAATAPERIGALPVPCVDGS